MTWPRLLVAVPSPPVRLVLLIRREPRHAVPYQDAVHRGARDGDLVESTQVGRDPASSEVIVLAQIQDLADHLASGRARRMLRRPRTIAQASVTVLGVSLPPLVRRFAKHPEPPADAGDILLVSRLL